MEQLVAPGEPPVRRLAVDDRAAMPMPTMSTGDIAGMAAAAGVLTGTASRTSHAAVAR